MRKYGKVLVTALCAALVLSSAGCGKKSDSKADDTSKVSSDSSSSASDNKDEDVSSSGKDTNGEIKSIDLATMDYSAVKLGDYSKIELDKSEIDSQTESTIKTNIKSTGDFKKVKSGKVKSGDTVNIFYVGKVDGKEFEGGSYTKEDNKDGFNLEIGSGSFIDGFEDALIGKKIGGTYDIDVTFPESYPANEDLAGKPAVFTVTLNYKQAYPEKLTDAFVKKNFKDFKDGYKNTAADYTKYIRENVIGELAWDKVYTASEVTEYPDDILDTVKVQYKTPIEYYLTQSGTTLDAYLENVNMSKDAFDEQLTKSATDDLKKRLIFGGIANKENISVDKKDYDRVLADYLKEYSCDDEDALGKLFAEYFFSTTEDIINNEILYSNVKDFLVSNVVEK